MHATPKDGKESRGSCLKDISLPPLIEGEFLQLSWSDLGYAVHGMTPHPWAEVIAFGNMQGLTIWELTTLKEMSNHYCSTYHRSDDKVFSPPYQKDSDDIDKQDLKLRAAVATASRKR